MDAGLLVALQVRAGLEPLGAVGAEVRPLARVRVQVLPQVGRLFEPDSTTELCYKARVEKNVLKKTIIKFTEVLRQILLNLRRNRTDDLLAVLWISTGLINFTTYRYGTADKFSTHLSLGLHEGRPSYRKSLQTSIKNIQHFKLMHFFPSFLWLILPTWSECQLLVLYA